MTPIEVSEVMAYMASAYPYINLSKETVAVYADLLADLDCETTRRAVRRLTALEERFPSPASIRKEVARLGGSLPPDATDALNEVLEQMQRQSRQQPIEKWSHPIIDEVVQSLGGLYRFRMSEQPDTLRAHFLRLYQSAVEKHERATILSKGAKEVGCNNETKRTLAQNATQTRNLAIETDTLESETVKAGVQ
jgi:hypothetical protein